MSNDIDVVVTGAGGFIGGHLTRDLLGQGLTVRAVDKKPLDEWSQISAEADSQVLDVSLLDDARQAVAGARTVYNLAADMGGMGFIETHKADCMLSVLISTHMLMAARDADVERYFYSSSACVYAAEKQTSTRVKPLREEPMPTRLMPKTAMAGRSCSASGCAATFWRTSACRRVSPAITTYTARSAPATAVAKRRRPRSAGRWRRPLLTGSTRSRSGATASKPAASCMSTTVSMARTHRGGR